MKATLTVEVNDLTELATLLRAIGTPVSGNTVNAPVVFTPITATAPPAPAPKAAPSTRPSSSRPSPPRPPSSRPPSGKRRSLSAIDRVLTALHELGGTVVDPRGSAVSPIAAHLDTSVTNVTHVLRDAADEGLVVRDVKVKRTLRIALTAAGYKRLGIAAPAAVPDEAEPPPPNLDATPRVVEVLEEDGAPLVFKTREQREAELRSAAAAAAFDEEEGLRR